MKVMVLVKATADSEAGVMPSAQLLADMGRFNDSLKAAGVMLAGDGLKPSRYGKRVRFSGKSRVVTDRRILAVGGEVDGGGGGMGKEVPESDADGFGY
jgi:hypothetical protein